jgi:pantetheine-phosphate adenylyltransferase
VEPVSMSTASKPLVGVYPGTFDPITRGHMDLICRAATIVDRLIIAVAANDGKGPIFPLEERLKMIGEEVTACDGRRADIVVSSFGGLLIHFCREHGARVLVRGLRAVSDFEYEFQMAAMNARQAPEIETIFFMASEKHQFISSSFVKEIGRLGGDISSLVTDNVRGYVERRVGKPREG